MTMLNRYIGTPIESIMCVMPGTTVECALVLIFILLFSGDIETNPGPVSRDQYKEMNKTQRTKVSKPDLETLLTQIIDSNVEGGTNAEILKELKDIKREIQEVKDLKLEVADNKKVIKELRSEIKELKDTVVAQQKFWEEIDKEKRCKKLVFLGIKEDKTEDDSKVKEILQTLQVSNEVEINQVKRLGKIRETEGDENTVHKRPLLVEVNTREMRFSVLKNSRKLKDSPEDSWMKSVFIKADEHPEIRKEMKRLNDVFKQERDKPENTGIEIRFDRKARKVTRNGETIDSFRTLSIFQ